MFGSEKFRLFLRHPGFNGKSKAPPPPDFTPVANASAESAKIAGELGREQLAENKRQFDESSAVSKPIIEQQARLGEQAYEQGNSNFETFRSEGRPIQQALRDTALGITSPDQQRLENEAADLTIADSRAGTTQQQNQLLREGARYGFSPDKLAAVGGTANVLNAQTQVAGANAARSQAKDRYYGRLGDVFNTYSGLGSSAPTFYQAGTQAGNSAVGNQNQTASQYINGISAGNSTIVQGQGQRIGGLSGVLGNQAKLYGDAKAGEGAATGAAVGGIITIGVAI